MKLMIPSVKESYDETLRGRTNRFRWFVSENKEIRNKIKWKNTYEKKRFSRTLKLIDGLKSLGGEDKKKLGQSLSLEKRDPTKPMKNKDLLQEP